MKKIKFIVCFFAVVSQLNCSTTPPSPLNQESSAVAIHVGANYHSAVLSLDCFRPEKVYFIKLDDSNTLTGKELVESTMNVEAWWGDNLIGRNTIYLFNLPPGRYAAVAAYGTGYINYDNVIYLFSEEMIKSTIVDVKPGSFVYIGAFVSEMGKMLNPFDNSDDVQKYYYKHFSSIYKDHGGLLSGHLIAERYYYIATPLKEKRISKDSKRKFLEEQLKEFSNTKWEVNIRRELQQLQ